MGNAVTTDLLRILGPTYFTGPTYFGEALSQTGQIFLFNSSSALATGFQAGNNSAAVTYTLPTAGPAANTDLLGSTTTGTMSWVNAAGTYAPIGSAFVTIGNTAGLTAERALTGTSNQIVVSDNGANSTVVLSTPQNIHTAATPTFASETLTATTNQLVLGTTRTVTITAPTPATSSRVHTILDVGAAANFMMSEGTQTLNGTYNYTMLTGTTFNIDPTLTGPDITRSNDTAGSSGTFRVRRTRVGAIVQSGDTVANIAFQGFDGAAYITAASITCAVDGTPGTDDMPGRLMLNTTPDAAAAATEAVRIDNAGHVYPMRTTGTQNFGDATNYWADISYKTLTDRGCLGWFEEGVELNDGSKVTDTQAILAIEKDDSKETVYGVPMLKYSSFPKACYKPAFGKGDDGVEMTSLFSIMIGCIKELTLRVAALETV